MLLNNLISNINFIKSSNIDFLINIASISDNSQKVEQNSIFVAVQGLEVDGNIFIKNAIEKGASLIITDKIESFEFYSNSIPILFVRNARKVLSDLLNIFYDFPASKLKVIGVTGTNGKTTTSTLLYNALMLSKKKVALIGTNGIFIENEKIEATHTTPGIVQLIQLFVEFRNKNIEFVVMEVSSHSLDQHRVDFINFDTAIFTNLTRDHLDYHKTMSNYAKAKKMLFDGLNPNSLAIINADDYWSQMMIQDASCEIKTLSIERYTDFRIENLISTINGNDFDLKWDNHILHLKSQLFSRFNAYNLASVAIALMRYGIDNIDLLLEKLMGPEGRMNSIKLHNGAIAIIDYAHTPDALEKALKNIKDLQIGRLFCVFGCGGDRDKGKRPQMGKISSELADFTIITSDNPRSEDPMLIINDIIVDMPEGTYEVLVDRREAIKKAIELSKQDDVILIAGKGHEKYQIIGRDKCHFDDFEEVTRFNQ